MVSQGSNSPELLLEQARRGDGEALGQLLDRFRNYLRLLTRSMVGPSLRVRMDYSDLIQDTFMKAHQGFAKFRGHSEPELVAWLRRIMANILANHVKQNQRRGCDYRRVDSLEALLDRSDLALQRALAAPGSSPSAHAVRRERAVLLADALENLTPDQKEVFVLRHLEHIPVAEIAARNGKSTAAVEMLWLRAVERLNSMLKEQP
jgi:RNA polymerase sigma-70 factor (ECF subfamily)